ncbi:MULTISPECIES: helix-turn-helix transcriptional regulator [Peptoniphilus]|uniref:helix-turn-helix transcriptional regulator n=1 Tax=Peptoniphilus TaxID=162289 RepID=UPI0001DA9BC7|nr:MULTISPECIES: helix-turn-helix transcriptional regulator [Peptoniphilus]EFI42377.1 transcriptional repressor CcpN [Peptoniphilus sp. oral taxon 386 str. F0131]
MDFTKRQLDIIEIVKGRAPITGDDIARELNISRATIRPDLSVLTRLNILGARPKVGYFYIENSNTSIFLREVDKILVKETMSVPVVMDENTSIYDVIVELFLENVSSIFITSNGFLTGVVSRKDLLRTTLGKMDLNNTPVAMIMTRMSSIVYVTENSSIIEAAIKINDRAVDSLPVVRITDGDLNKLKVIGRFTKTNVNRIFVELVKEGY